MSISDLILLCWIINNKGTATSKGMVIVLQKLGLLRQKYNLVPASFFLLQKSGSKVITFDTFLKHFYLC